MSEKVRVHEIAKELGIDSKEVVVKAAEIGLDIKTASSSVSMNDAEKIANYIINGAPAPKPATPKVTVKKAAKKDDDDLKSEEKAASEKPAEKAQEKTAAAVKTETAADAVSEKSAEPAPKESADETKPAAEKSANGPKVMAPIKRPGLTIVKKKKPKVEKVDNAASASAAALKVSSYGKVSEEEKQKRRG